MPSGLAERFCRRSRVRSPTVRARFSRSADASRRSTHERAADKTRAGTHGLCEPEVDAISQVVPRTGPYPTRNVRLLARDEAGSASAKRGAIAGPVPRCRVGMAIAHAVDMPNDSIDVTQALPIPPRGSATDVRRTTRGPAIRLAWVDTNQGLSAASSPADDDDGATIELDEHDVVEVDRELDDLDFDWDADTLVCVSARG